MIFERADLQKSDFRACGPPAKMFFERADLQKSVLFEFPSVPGAFRRPFAFLKKKLKTLRLGGPWLLNKKFLIIIADCTQSL